MLMFLFLSLPSRRKAQAIAEFQRADVARLNHHETISDMSSLSSSHAATAFLSSTVATGRALNQKSIRVRF